MVNNDFSGANFAIWLMWFLIIIPVCFSKLNRDEINWFGVTIYERFIGICWGLLYIIGTIICVNTNVLPVIYWTVIGGCGIPILIISIFTIIAVIKGIIKFVEYLAMHLKIPKVTINVKVDYWKN